MPCRTFFSGGREAERIPMQRRILIVYGLLVLAPALVIGVLAFRLLGHEQERLRLASVAAIEERAQAVAENIRISVEDAEEGLLSALASLPEPELPRALKEWRGQNTLVRNVFILNPARGLLLPEPMLPGSSPAAPGDSAFVRRYEGLFALNVPWPAALAESASAAVPVGKEEAPPAAGSGRITRLPRDRKFAGTVRVIAPSPSVARISAAALTATVDKLPVKKSADYESQMREVQAMESQARSGWIPWISDNTLSLLGWLQPSPDKPVRGLELDLDVLLPRLVATLPPQPPEGMAFVVSDGNRMLCRPSCPVSAAMQVLCRVPVGSELPHWEVVVLAVPGAAGVAAGGKMLRTLSLLLTGTFLMAILTGGALLLFAAYRGQLDARRKTSFVSNVSHELKTPLTSIRMYAELLGEGRVRDEGKKKRYLDNIIVESQRLTRLISNVLDFSRIEQNRKVYNITEADLVQIVRGVIERLSMRIQEAGIHVEMALPSGGLVLRTDSDAVEQVLINLVDNAMKYAASGRELRIEMEAAPDGCARIRVLDRGPGIPPAEREKVFDKFYRMDHSLTGGKPGCGLGLTISRKMLRDLGGELACGPRDGGGTCFTAELRPKPVEEETQQG